MAAAMANPLAGPSHLRDIIRPQFHQNNFVEESFIKNELGLKLDKGMHTSLENAVRRSELLHCAL